MNKKQKPGPAGTRAVRPRGASRSPGDEGGGGRSINPRGAEPTPEPFSAAELRQISAQITAQWFRPMEANRLMLMEVDPWRVHAYWNVAETDLATARASLPGDGRDAALVLRFTDLSPRTADTAPPHERFDVEVQQARNNWYVGLWRDAKHYSAELGLRAANGAFVALARSNEVVTPRGGPSPELDFRHMEVRPPRAVKAYQPVRGTDHSDALLRNLFPTRLRPEEDYPLAIAETAGVMLEEPPFPSLDQDAGDGDEIHSRSGEPPDTSAPSGSTGNEVTGPAKDFPVIAAAEIQPYHALANKAKARVLARIRSRLPPVAEETVSPTDVDLRPLPLPIPPAPASDGRAADSLDGAHAGHPLGGPQVLAQDAFGGWPHIPLEGLLGGAVFSYGQLLSPVQVSVDIIIHGRSDPDSALMLFGDAVQLDADGSFTVQLPLKRGPELAALLRHLSSRYGDKDDG